MTHLPAVQLSVSLAAVPWWQHAALLTCCESEGVFNWCWAAHTSSSMLPGLPCSGGLEPPGCRQHAVYVDPDETFSPRLDKRSTRLAAKVGQQQALSL